MGKTYKNKDFDKIKKLKKLKKDRKIKNVAKYSELLEDVK